jgi:hypothetical protein
MKRGLIAALLGVGLLPGVAVGQGRGLTAACGEVQPVLQTTCRVVGQAVESAQPGLGVLITGGNPTIGTASAGGLRLGVLPRVSATVKGNLVFARIPDLRDVRTTPTDGMEYREMTIVAPALSGTATMGLFSGISVAPTIGGIGSVDLLATASWLPLSVLKRSEFRSASADLSWGGGVRLGILRESFTMPGASLSVMYHQLGKVELGEICHTRLATSTSEGSGYSLEEGQCASDGNTFTDDPDDFGEFSFDLSSWSTRAAVSKHLLGLGLSAGVGYDHFSSELAAGVRAPGGAWTPPNNPYAHVTDVTLSQDRWSAFVDGSFSILVTTFAAEVGWQQGGEAITGYPQESSDFDPAAGTFFGSLGLRVAL